MSSLGKGDIREPFIEVTYPNGSSTTDMVFDRAEIIQGKEEYDTLRGLMMIMERLNSSSSILRTGIIISHWSFIIMYMKNVTL